MKKLFICLLMFILAFCTFTSCGNKDSGESAEEIIKDEPLEHDLGFPQKLGELYSEGEKKVEIVYYYDSYFGKYGYEMTDAALEELKKTFTSTFIIGDNKKQRTSFINRYLREQDIKKENPDGTSYTSDGEQIAEYYIDQHSGKICFVINLDHKPTCIAVNPDEMNVIGNLVYTYEHEESTFFEAFYNEKGDREVIVSYKYLPNIPFPIILENKNGFTNESEYYNSFAYYVLMRNERFLFQAERAQFDESGKMTEYRGCLNDKWLDDKGFDDSWASKHTAFVYYDAEDRLEAVSENLLEEEFMECFLDRNSSGFLTVRYQENSYPSTVEHSFSSLSHNTTDSSGTTYYDKDGRMIIRHYYYTSGSYTDAFFYEGESRRPWARISVGGLAFSGGDDYEFGMNTGVYIFSELPVFTEQNH